MKPQSAPRVARPLLLLAAASALACGSSRSEEMQRQIALEHGEKKKKEDIPEKVPPHPMRDKLLPVLEKIYPLNAPPGVMEADIAAEGDYKYELTAGVASIIRLPQGLSDGDKVKAIVLATAEADAWAHRPDARRDYADLVNRVKRGFGDDQKELILKHYAHLRLLQFFNSPDAQAAIDKLPSDVKSTVQEMSKHYVENKTKLWEDWMAVKMYARRVVAGDEPFRGVLREIKKELGHAEPPPRTWEDSFDEPFKTWGAEIKANEELFIKLTDLRELKDREQFFTETHSLWVMEGSPLVPPKAKKIPIDKNLQFGVLREDLGGGYNDLTYVFSKSLSGPALKKAFLRSIIYGQLLTDFQMLATAGSDFAERDENNVIDAPTAVVPDKYDPLYARCGSGAALDTFISHYKSKFPLLADLSGASNEEQILEVAHKCVIDGAAGVIYVPAKDNEKDVEGPAPGSRLAIYQMLARFETVDVDMAKMGSDVKTEEDEVIEDAEAVLKKIKAKENEGKGVK